MNKIDAKEKNRRHFNETADFIMPTQMTEDL